MGDNLLARAEIKKNTNGAPGRGAPLACIYLWRTEGWCAISIVRPYFVPIPSLSLALARDPLPRSPLPTPPSPRPDTTVAPPPSTPPPPRPDTTVAPPPSTPPSPRRPSAYLRRRSPPPPQRPSPRSHHAATQIQLPIAVAPVNPHRSRSGKKL